MYKSIIKKKKKNLDKIKLSGKDKLNAIEVLISESLIDSYISHDKSVSVNNVLREYNEIKNEIKHPETSVKVLISKFLIDSYISHDKSISVNNVLREYNEIENKIKHLKLL